MQILRSEKSMSHEEEPRHRRNISAGVVFMKKHPLQHFWKRPLDCLCSLVNLAVNQGIVYGVFVYMLRELRLGLYYLRQNVKREKWKEVQRRCATTLGFS